MSICGWWWKLHRTSRECNMTIWTLKLRWTWSVMREWYQERSHGDPGEQDTGSPPPCGSRDNKVNLAAIIRRISRGGVRSPTETRVSIWLDKVPTGISVCLQNRRLGFWICGPGPAHPQSLAGTLGYFPLPHPEARHPSSLALSD